MLNETMQAVLFDLDNTLYPAECDLFSLIDVRINRYMQEVVAIPAGDVDYLRRRYWQDYGTTLKGLMNHHDVSPEDYLDYVHDIDVASRVSVDSDLRRILEALPLSCYVFTNGSRCHADRVITALGLDGVFGEIFDIRVAEYQPKPHIEPYERVLQQLGLDASQCIMVEDQPKNLVTAKQLGMRTILVAPASAEEHSHVDARIDRSAEISQVYQRWNEESQ
jgi:putative hydrolase of the HAD superfamily